MKKQAIILAGGKGRRLMPFTRHTPKPLILLKNKPFIYYIIKQLEFFGIKEVLIISGYKSYKFKKFLKKFKYHFNLQLKLIIQPSNWQTAKRIYKIEKKLNKKFYLLYADNLVNLKKNNFEKFKTNSILVQHHSLANELGNIKIINKKIISYNEMRNKISKYVELGYFYLSKKYIFSLLNAQNISFSKILTKIVEQKRIIPHKTKGTYLSITNIKNVKRSEKLIRKFQFLHLF